MTPAIHTVQQANIKYVIHEYIHDPNTASYGLEAAEALGVEPARVFKTLLVRLPGDKRRLAVGIVPVEYMLDLKKLAHALNVKKVVMAEPREAERVTGYVVGGISPLGQRQKLETVLDETAMQFATVFVSAGRRGLEIELTPADLQHLCQSRLASIQRD